jgi:hypothetical protein
VIPLRSRRLPGIALMIVALAVTGCGKSGPDRIEITGTVTFKGKPVPAGNIVFDPDPKRGNDGPGAFAHIKQGRFDTRDAGKGPIAGVYQAHVTGMDGVPGPEMPQGHILFSQWTTDVEVDRSKTDFHFDVPVSAARKP